MATIVLYYDRMTNVVEAVNEAANSSNGLQSQLRVLKSTLHAVNNSTCNLQNTIDNIRSSTKTESEKVEDLKNLSDKLIKYVKTVLKSDRSARDEINKSKEEFYTKYSYLKPNCEKGVLEKISDGFVSACKWCADNWDSILSILKVIVVVVGLVVASVLTFGAAAVIAVAAVGLLVGLGCQLSCDINSLIMTGKWDVSWQDYVGSALGGAVGGLLTLSVGPEWANFAGAYISTFTSEHLSNLTGGEKKSSFAISLDSSFDAGLSLLLGKAFKMPVKSGKKWLSNIFRNVPALKRLAGSGNYGASFDTSIEKLRTGINKTFTWKTLRNGVVNDITDAFPENFVQGFRKASEKNDESSNKVDVRSKKVDVSIDYSKFSYSN